jgi:hypothetical protein
VNQDDDNELPPPNKASWSFKNYPDFEKQISEDQNPDYSHLKHLVKPKRSRLAFIGNMNTNVIRRAMGKQAQAVAHGQFRAHNFRANACCARDSSIPQVGTQVGGSVLWRAATLSADVNLCPIGTAPVSYRLFETLQMGVIPFHIYDHRGNFVPYQGTKADVKKIGFVAKAGHETPVLKKIVGMKDEDIVAMRKGIMELRDSHFTPKGAMDQLKKWLQDPGGTVSDLRCRMAD